MLSVTILSINLVGDAVRDALDPRMAKRGDRPVSDTLLDIRNLGIGLGGDPGYEVVKGPLPHHQNPARPCASWANPVPASR